MAIGRKKEPDEYQLPEDEFEGQDHVEEFVEEPITQPRNRISSVFRYKKILVVLGLIIAIIIVYEVSNMFDKQPAQPQVPQQAPVAQPAPVATNTNQLADLSNQTQNLNSAMSALMQQSNANKSNIQVLQNGLVQLETNQKQLNQQLSAISSSLQQIETKIAQLTAPKPKVAKAKYTPPPPVYHLKAVLPGRAWLQSNHNKTITVTVGDYLSGYGTVTWINSDLGAVSTSSGKIIRYGTDDY